MKEQAEAIPAEVQPTGGSAGEVRAASAPIGKDKILHIICCFAIALMVAVAVHILGLGVSASGVIGFFAALIAGVAKEIYDVFQSLSPSSFSWKDILADVAGTLVGSALWLVLTRHGFDFNEFLIYGFTCSMLSIFAAVFSFPFVCVAIERKSINHK